MLFDISLNKKFNKQSNHKNLLFIHDLSSLHLVLVRFYLIRRQLKYKTYIQLCEITDSTFTNNNP